ncbi:MAG TPA: hypothetical protein VLC95_13970 [Anaerolineae bacterium]|nr:hypothetical protein [Anaerolineae bacterium]
MKRNIKTVLPVVAVVSVAIALVSIASSALLRADMIEDTGATRPGAEAVAARLQALHPLSVGDPAFMRAAAEAEAEAYVAYVWVLAADGTILRGNLAAREPRPVESMATDEMMRVLGALPPETLDAEQRLALLAASAMQAEGEHNDVFRHLVRTVRAPDGSLTGLVGVTYDASVGTGLPSLAFAASVLAGFGAMGIYWLSLPAWVWLDATERGERATVWAMFVLLGNLVALIAYVLARVPRSQPATA